MSEPVSEFVPPIILEHDPVSRIPHEALMILGQLMAWSAHIEADLFALYAIAKGGDLIKLRRFFYKTTAGLYQRSKLVREAFAERFTAEDSVLFEKLLDEVEVLASVRNEWAHNPLIRYGPEEHLCRWQLASNDFAGTVSRLDLDAVQRVGLPSLPELHNRLLRLIGFLGNPTGGQVFFVFGELTNDVAGQLRSLGADPGAASDPGVDHAPR